MTKPAVGTAVVIGAGPAGCSCASWLAQQGIATTLVEAQADPLPALRKLDLRQSWVLGAPDTSTADLALQYEQHVRSLPLVRLRCGAQVVAAPVLSGGRKVLELSDGSTVEGAALVVATGLRPRPHPWQQPGGRQALDAIGLTLARQQSPGGRVLLLGGGDNAVENALFLAGRGHSVVLWSRSRPRAQPLLLQKLEQYPQIEQRFGVTMPTRMAAAGAGWQVESGRHGVEAFDLVAVLFGFEPDDTAWQALRASPAWADAGWPAAGLAQASQLAPHGVFVAGDASLRLHPSIQTALADGVTAAKQVNQWFCNRLPPK